MGYYDTFKGANNFHSTIVAFTFLAAILIGAIGLGRTDRPGGLKPGELEGGARENSHRTVHQFSVHAYQSDAPGSITLAGPFLGKIRVAKNATAKTLVNDTALTDYKFQASCMNITDVEARGKCQIMRTPPMYLGKIHSAWSVLGAQSITTLVKHIFWILLAFAIFSMSELWMRRGFCHDTQRTCRLGVVGLAIILFVVDFVWDFAVGNMHSLDAGMESVNAIGSVTTGASVWLVCLLIICFSHVDDVVVVKDIADIDSEETKKKKQLYQAESENYKRFEAQMHLNVNVSFLILLLLPLFALLSLTSFGMPVVDVHVQLVFFSYIFFAVLDVLQSRVMSVLASLKEASSLTAGIGTIKAFVVLAFVLCKFFVFFPTWQLMGHYYAPPDDSVPSYLHIFEIILVLGLSVADLFYSLGILRMIHDMVRGAYTIGLSNPNNITRAELADLKIPAIEEIETYASCRAGVLCIYLFGSFITLACITPV